MQSSNRKYFSLFDLIIILFVVVVSAFALMSQFVTPAEDGKVCVIRVSGQEVYEIPLSDINDSITYKVDGELLVEVTVGEDGVFVKSSQCSDKLCEHTGKISRVGQSIVCLPAKVSVTIEGSNSNELDVVVG